MQKIQNDVDQMWKIQNDAETLCWCWWLAKYATVAVLVPVSVSVHWGCEFIIVGLRFCVWTFAAGEHVVSYCMSVRLKFHSWSQQHAM